MSKLVLITGVTGQDGSLMADYLLANTDYEIRGMVRRSAKPDYSNIKNALNNPRFQLVVGDLGDSQSIDNLVKKLKPDYFINFAAQSFVGSSWDIPLQTIQAGATGVVYCLEAIRNYAPQCRFYNAGSSEEFGDVVTIPQNETHPPTPLSPYGGAKGAARLFVRVYKHSYNLYAIQGHLFNHEGVRRGEEFVTRKITKGVARIANILKSGDFDFAPIELGNIDAKRDWSDAEDFIDGVWRMLNQDVYRTDLTGPFSNKDAREYVLSSNETHTVREFIFQAFQAVGINVVWHNMLGGPENEELILGDERGLATKRKVTLVKINPKFYRPADVNILLGDSSRARKELGWTPKTTFAELVNKMVRNDMELFSK